jgi:hypothetical protein
MKASQNPLRVPTVVCVPMFGPNVSVSHRRQPTPTQTASGQPAAAGSSYSRGLRVHSEYMHSSSMKKQQQAAAASRPAGAAAAAVPGGGAAAAPAAHMMALQPSGCTTTS